jgi:LacI family transcriptional regulator
MKLKELATRLNLSPTTVSRALGGYSDVSAATRERVEQAAREFGYQPNQAARQIAIGRADAVGIVYSLAADYLGNPDFLATLSGMSQRLQQRGVDLLLTAAPEQDELAVYERMVRGRRVDALVVAHTAVHDARIDYLRRAGMPFVAYGRTADAQDYPWFDFDNAAGGRMAVRELAALGHQRIAYVHSPLRLNFAHQRHEGFLDGMRRARLPVDPQDVVAGGLERRQGYAAGKALAARSRAQRPSAIIVDSCLGGVGVVRAMLDSGLKVGRDVSVLVYENAPPEAALLQFSIASIMQPTPLKTGQTLGDMVLALANGETLAQPHVLQRPRFFPGASVGPPA